MATIIKDEEEKYENHNLDDLEKQIEMLPDAGMYEKIIDITTSLPKEQITYYILDRLAVAYHNNAEYEKCLYTLMLIKDKAENTALWNYYAGSSYYYMQNYGEAEKYFTTCLKIEPEIYSASSLLFYTYIMFYYQKLDEKEYDKALDYLNKCSPLIKSSGEKILFESELSYLYRLRSEYEKAYQHIKKVMTLGRKDSWVYSEAGLCLYGLEEYEEALENFEKAFEFGREDSWLYYFALWSAHYLGDKQKQLEYLEKGLKLYPDDIDLNYTAGVYYYINRKYSKALIYFNKSEQYSDKTELYTFLGFCNEKTGAYDKALYYYEKAQSIQDLAETRKMLSSLKKKKTFLLVFKIILVSVIIKVLLDIIF